MLTRTEKKRRRRRAPRAPLNIFERRALGVHCPSLRESELYPHYSGAPRVSSVLKDAVYREHSGWRDARQGALPSPTKRRASVAAAGAHLSSWPVPGASSSSSSPSPPRRASSCTPTASGTPARGCTAGGTAWARTRTSTAAGALTHACCARAASLRTLAPRAPHAYRPAARACAGTRASGWTTASRARASRFTQTATCTTVRAPRGVAAWRVTAHRVPRHFLCVRVCLCVVCVRVPLSVSGRRVAGRAHQRLRHADVRRRRQVRGAVGGRENERPGHVHLRRRRQVRRRVEGRPAARQGHGHLPRRRRRGGGEVRGRLVRGQDARPRPLRLRRQRRVPGPVGGLENVRQGHVRLPQRQQVRGRVGGRRQGRLRRAHVRQRRAL